ncbi:MAG: hypothetical protein IH911_00090 [Proteobacteria bacterium]|nr:hypothetical protein [Pseudomonadota bacterium]
MCLSLFCFSNSLAGVDICRQPTVYSQLSIAYYKHEKSSFESGIGETKQENVNFDLLFKLNDNWAFGAGHRYTILNVEPLELQTNGHLHTFFLPLHRQSQSDRKSFRFSIAPALSASSNVMKDPGEYKTDALQLLAALVWSRQISDRMNVRYGVCGDHRFGRYEIYPLISVAWQPHADWTVELGFPASQLTYRVSRSLTSSLRIAPDGNEWYVRDKSLQKRSRLVYEARMLEWAFNWQAHEHIVMTASVGRQFHNRYEMTLLDDSRVRLSSDAVTRIGAALAWRF